jgi:probable blue pigment (indigoidine) exporter
VLAPISWGTSYITITELLPDDRPLLVATMRVVPSGLLLLLAGALGSRWRPRGRDWWRTGVLAVANFGAFFPCSSSPCTGCPVEWRPPWAGCNPSSLAPCRGWSPGTDCDRSTWRLDASPRSVWDWSPSGPAAALDPVGVLAAVGANVSFAVGVVLTKRFPTPPNRLAATGWQLLLGGAILLPLTAIVDGGPPSVTWHNMAGFAYLSVVATALAFVLWFNGVRRLPTVAPPLLGLAAPITGAALGWAILGQSLSPLQLTGFVMTVGAISYGAFVPAALDRQVQDRMQYSSRTHGRSNTGGTISLTATSSVDPTGSSNIRPAPRKRWLTVRADCV